MTYSWNNNEITSVVQVMDTTHVLCDDSRTRIFLLSMNKSDAQWNLTLNDDLSAQSEASIAEQFTKHCHLHAGADTSHFVPNTAGSDEVAWHGKAIHWTRSDEIIKDPNSDACLIIDGDK